ncbi:hypothetical protein N7462_000679 [Penicillium macrosclerotiorum]|uniref:uncharacterized protein n=1 Tax=Penicillium macrosclerotiorum TaxID=303699 RepID=UPI00254803BB|nr:uncharacterized protein N7462_000679 [Penicillium macrosclerotiorum]KAJ5698674.1 hypothetical protein N7462_000679 [Penicillium macrosclerotiorum]
MQDRIHVRGLTNIIAIDTQPITNSRIAKRVKSIRDNLEDRDTFIKEAFADGFRSFEALLVKRGQNGAYCFGEFISMADVVLVPAIDRALMYKMDLDFVPNVKRIYFALKELESFKAADWRSQGDTPERFRIQKNNCELSIQGGGPDSSYFYCNYAHHDHLHNRQEPSWFSTAESHALLISLLVGQKLADEPNNVGELIHFIKPTTNQHTPLLTKQRSK